MLLLLGAVVALYAPVLGFEYVWDDRTLFLDSSALSVIRSAQEFWAAVTQPILPGTTYFRPLVLGSFAGEFAFAQVNPAVSHAVNLAIFLVNILLVGALAMALLPRELQARRHGAALAAMLLYGLHPVLNEPVAWVAGRFDLMVTTFVLAGLLLDLRTTGWVRIVSVAACFGLAALSKEMAATFPALLVLIREAARGPDLAWKDRIKDWLRGDNFKVLVAVLLVGVAYLALRGSVMPGLVHQDEGLASRIDWREHLSLVGQTMWFYARMTLWPFSDLNPQHPLAENAFEMPWLLAGWIALTGFGLAGLALGWSRRRVALILLAGGISLLPVLHIRPLTIGGNIGHERFLALPLAFAVTALAVAVPAWKPQWKRLGALVLAGWALFSAMNLRVTLPLWSNDLALWSWAEAKHPDSPAVQYALASVALRMNRLDLFERIYTQQIDVAKPIQRRQRVLYAYYLQRKGDSVGAAREIDLTLAGLTPPHETGQPSGEPGITEKAASGHFYAFSYLVKAVSRLSLRQFDEALAAADAVLYYAPTHSTAFLAKAFALWGLGRPDEARALFEEARLRGVFKLQPAGTVEDFLRQLCVHPDAPRSTCAELNENVSGQEQGVLSSRESRD
ncbi:tetratricopeptide repeat protein [Caldimonas thermodepolymerans]|jgi:hypothetical protein|uniref:tetratricopeptide repeat protein n=1 Tax=Caldimonas thermodepolymerans TaxID=215580 RepID=UPI002492CD0D|nr:tetratricopeptide repeat protein [Caldimonas thermodepolymerans]